MPLVPDEERSFAAKLFQENLKNKVRIAVFTRETDCPYCQATVNLIEETANLTDKIEVYVFDTVKDREKLGDFTVDFVPAVAVIGQEECRIMYYGLPSGYIYRALIDDIINISRGSTNLLEETKTHLRSIDKPVHIRVLVKLTCQRCLLMVRVAHQFALENPNISSDVIDIEEFPDVELQYTATIIPKTIVNESVQFYGVAHEKSLIDYVFQALKIKKKEESRTT